MPAQLVAVGCFHAFILDRLGIKVNSAPGKEAEQLASMRTMAHAGQKRRRECGAEFELFRHNHGIESRVHFQNVSRPLEVSKIEETGQP
jgi:hypothetical protein